MLWNAIYSRIHQFLRGRALRMACTRLLTRWASLLQAVTTRARPAHCLRPRALRMVRTRAVVLHQLLTRWASLLQAVTTRARSARCLRRLVPR